MADYDPFADDDPFFTPVDAEVLGTTANSVPAPADKPAEAQTAPTIPEPAPASTLTRDTADLASIDLAIAGNDDEFFGAPRNDGDDDEASSGAEGKRSGSGSSGDEEQYTLMLPSWLAWVSPDYYRKFCDVDTLGVLKRLGLAMVPYSGHFTKLSLAKYELYGPIWLSMTYVCILAVTSALVTKFNAVLHSNVPEIVLAGQGNYDINRIIFAFVMVALFGTIVPIVFWVTSLVASATLPFVAALDITVYSIIPSIISVPFVLVPYSLVGYIAWVLGTVFTAVHLLTNLGWMIQQRACKIIPALVLVVVFAPLFVLWNVMLRLVLLGFSLDFSYSASKMTDMARVLLKP